MILFSPAKINLGLRVISKRNDGYHNLKTVFYQIPLADSIEIIEDKKVAKNNIKFFCSGRKIDSKNNLCIKAYDLLKKKYDLPGVILHLNKVIPIGAGLGGGSSNAIYTLKILDKIFNLGISPTEMLNYAKNLGSDCSLFISKKTQYGYGKGDELSPYDIKLNGKFLYIVYPNINISTKEIFEQIKIKNNVYNILEVLKLSPKKWRGKLVNDLESHVFEKYSILKSIKDNLYSHGAIYASMSGSGSSIFGIFEKYTKVRNISPDFFTWGNFV